MTGVVVCSVAAGRARLSVPRVRARPGERDWPTNA